MDSSPYKAKIESPLISMAVVFVVLLVFRAGIERTLLFYPSHQNPDSALDQWVINGEVIDLHRRDFLRNYLRETERAIADGVPVRGYFLWSFMDNYEWEDGYLRRFGIVHVDFATQKRTPKLSAHYYSKIMTENRIL